MPEFEASEGTKDSKPNLPDKITSAEIFYKIMRDSSEQRRVIIYNSIDVVRLIHNSLDLSYILEFTPLKERKNVLAKVKLLTMISNVNEFIEVIAWFTPKERIVIYPKLKEKLLEIVNDQIDLIKVINCLPVKNARDFCLSIHERKPETHFISDRTLAYISFELRAAIYVDFLTCWKGNHHLYLNVQLDVVIKIYQALLVGQSSFFKINYLHKLKNLAVGEDKFAAILLHIRKSPKSRMAKAWQLAQGRDLKNLNEDTELFKKIYQYSFKKSCCGLSHLIAGQSIFSNKRLKVLLSQQQLNLSELEKSDSHRRSAKIITALKSMPQTHNGISSLIKPNIRL
jgi:hypothetical protein